MLVTAEAFDSRVEDSEYESRGELMGLGLLQLSRRF